MGGGSVSVPSFGSELGQVTKGFGRKVVPAFNQFVAGNPLLSTLQQYGLDLSSIGMGMLPYGQGFMQAAYPGVQQAISQGIGLANAAYPYLQQVISSQGALTPQERNLATQQAREAFQARGNVFGNQAVAAEALNRDQYKWQKYAQALGLAGSIFRPEQAAMGMGGQTLGFGQQTMGIGQQALQALGYPAQTQAGVFGTLINPLYGLAASQMQAATSAAEANQAKQASLIGSGIDAVGNIVGGVIGAGGFSDKRLKTDIRKTGEKTPEGVPIVGFRYKGDKRRYIGVLAQDVAKHVPEAVAKPSWTKYAMVDFSKIAAPFQEVAARRTSKDEPSWMQYAAA